MQTDKILGSLGLARRAGKLVLGFDAVKEAVILCEAELVLIAQDTSQGNTRRITALCEELECPVLTLPHTQEQLAQMFNRNTGVLALTDPNLAALCRKNLQ